MPERFERKRLSDMVATEIRRMVEDGGFGPGDKIYSENELTRTLEVSRTSVREAIRILEVQGLLTVRQGKGIFVRDSAEERAEALGRWIQSNSDNLFEIFEIRILMEPDCAARAAHYADAEEIAEMREALRRFEDHCAKSALQGAIAQDKHFHNLVARASQNRTLHVLMSTFTRSLNEGWITSLSLPGRQIKTISEHRAILDAIEAHDAEGARRAMRVHLENAFSEVREYAKDSGDRSDTEHRDTADGGNAVEGGPA